MEHAGTKQTPVTRRAFLAGAGGFLAGAALGSRLFSAVGLAAPAQPEPPAWPWTYVPLDPEVVRRKGYEGYFEGGCCYGAAEAILSELREKVGYPFTGIPSDMFRYGAGGAAGWGTLCGALNGAAAVINLVTTQADCNAIVNELFGWYCETALPTEKSQGFGPANTPSVASSPLCHVSLSRWADAEGVKINSPEKKQRCGKLTGDVAARAVELLNAWQAGKFVAAYQPPESVAECQTCHGPEELDDAHGKMDCVQCHQPH